MEALESYIKMYEKKNGTINPNQGGLHGLQMSAM